MPITKGIGAYHDKEGLGGCFSGGLAENGNGNDQKRNHDNISRRSSALMQVMNLVDIVCSQSTSRQVHYTARTNHIFMHNLQTYAQVIVRLQVLRFTEASPFGYDALRLYNINCFFAPMTSLQVCAIIARSMLLILTFVRFCMSDAPWFQVCLNS